MKPIAVLGCGPAGLLAAHALAITEMPFAIFSRIEKSKLGGAQFLHKPIPLLTEDDPEFEIDHITRGSIEDYRLKVYGPEFNLPQDPNNIMPQTGEKLAGWSLVKAYDKLWEAYKDKINADEITPAWPREHHEYFSMVLSTVPATRMCKHPGRHQFISKPIRIANQCVEFIPENTIVFDGTKDRSWYRCANVMGFQSTEWAEPVPKIFPFSDTVIAIKPLSTNCNCHTSHTEFRRLGRRGTWSKNEFTHHAFYQTLKIVRDHPWPA